MKVFFPNNSRHNKAAMILATFAPDTVSDIIDLVFARGRALPTDLAGDDGPPRANAIFSRNYVADQDFPEMFIGSQVVALAQLRTLVADQDFYETVFMNAFGIPKQMAAAFAKQADTLDLLAGPEFDKKNWFSQMGSRLQETIRTSANWVTSVLQLPFENDQTQAYDLDRLYEFKIVGKIADDLASRTRLMTAQAAIAGSMGIFKATDGSVETGDAEMDHELLVGDIMAPLLGASIPMSLYGGFGKVASIGQAASTAQAQRMVSDAGMSKDPKAGKTVKNPMLRDALQKVLTASPGKLALVTGGLALTPSLVKIAAKMIKNAKTSSQTGDAMEDVASKFGEEIAHSMATGDVMGVLEGLGSLGGDIESTGDPDLDEAIIGDVLAEMQEEGDVDDGSEIGGLVRRMRINAAVRQGSRKSNRTAKRRGKIANRKAETDALIDAKRFKSQAHLNVDDYETSRPRPYYRDEEEQEEEGSSNPDLGADQFN